MIHSPGASPSPLCGGLRPTPSLISPASFCRKTWMFQSSGTPLLFLGILLHYPCPKSLVFTVVIIFNGRWYLFFLAFGSSFSLQCTALSLHYMLIQSPFEVCVCLNLVWIVSYILTSICQERFLHSDNRDAVVLLHNLISFQRMSNESSIYYSGPCFLKYTAYVSAVCPNLIQSLTVFAILHILLIIFFSYLVLSIFLFYTYVS